MNSSFFCFSRKISLFLISALHFFSRFGSSKPPAAEDEDSSDSDEGQAFYAGGSEHSGQQILGPAKKKEGADFVKHMFKKAREQIGRAHVWTPVTL